MAQQRFTGKVVLVTGGATGMGATHARRFVAEGAAVAITDLRTAEGEQLAEELGDRARFFSHDVADAERWSEVVGEAEAEFGPVDALVNNAGVVHSGSVEDLTEPDYRRVIDINQLGVFLGMRAVVPSMRRAGGGSIVNVSSAAGLVGSAHAFAYTASKWAVRGMTKAAALDLAPHRIRVNSVHPGATRTPMITDTADGVGLDTLAGITPLGRIAEAEEVTHLVAYLASEESSFSTGSEFVVDGGLTAQ